MAHAIWKGSVSFGLVNVPVSVYSGEDRGRELGFSMVDKRDMSPIGYKKINKTTGEEVPKNAVGKAFELDEGKYVTLSDEDFKRASPERTQRVDIAAFVDAGDIDPAYFDKPYYLEPAAKSEKVYALLREAMIRSKKIGVASVVIRSKQYLAVVVPRDRLLELCLLRYADELRDPGELHLPDRDLKKLKITEAELKMAERLIEDLAAPWEPAQYKDEYREELLEFIKRKAAAGEGKEMPPEAKKPRTAPPADIMALLKASLAAGSKGKPPRTAHVSH